MTAFPLGKLPADQLRTLLDRYHTPDPSIIVGPRLGEDAAVLDLGDCYLVTTTDPITFATDEIGSYAVHVNANDIACSGATPRWFLATILLPEGAATPELTEAIFRQITAACQDLGVSLCGGHTEITHGLQSPIIVGQMLGTVAPERHITTSGAQVGDTLLLTKGFALEGTAILAREHQATLQQVMSVDDLNHCIQWLHQPGISVVRDAQLALEIGGVHALHDPTEGGVATGLWELAQASGVGLIVDADALPVLPECQRICDHFGLDPLGLIGSGALLIAAAADQAGAIAHHLTAAGIAATKIGTVVPQSEGCCLREANQTLQPLPQFARDQITYLF